VSVSAKPGTFEVDGSVEPGIRESGIFLENGVSKVSSFVERDINGANLILKTRIIEGHRSIDY
jgi:hypothetical protein